MGLFDKAQQLLRERFGYPSFRPGQKQAVRSVLEGHDVLAVMPTGAGKSICYQVPAAALEGMAIVISPLISLMSDQVRACKEAGISAAFLNSTLQLEEKRQITRAMLANAVDVVYITPEQLVQERFAAFMCKLSIGLVAVVEAHCISQWGHDFRPSYQGIGPVIAALPKRPPVMALTATATPRVSRDICQLLGLRQPVEVRTGFDRPNLAFYVRRTADSKKTPAVLEYLRSHPQDAGIVYCSTRKKVDEVYQELLAAGIKAGRYKGDMAIGQREAYQRDFINDDTQVMVATNAFGMGIDKSNVRFVIHYNMPASIEAYYQEAGRAGRDGEPAECILLWSENDIRIQRLLIDSAAAEAAEVEGSAQAGAGKQRLLSSMVSYCHTAGCLRRFILGYFEEGAQLPERCGNCGNCLGEAAGEDVTKLGLEVAACVRQLRWPVGKGTIAEILRGSRSAKIRDKGYDQLDCYGSSNASAQLLRDVVELMAAEGYLAISEGEYPVVTLGPRAAELSSAGFSLQMKHAPKAAAKASSPAAGRSSNIPLQGSELELFQQLRALRKAIADEDGVPPYVVFSDKSLREMASLRPQDEDSFLAVNGVGTVKLEHYGQRFMEAIASFLEEHEGQG